MGHNPHTWAAGEVIAAATLNSLELAASDAAAISDLGVAGTATDTALRAAFAAQIGASNGTNDTAKINALLAAGGVVRGTPGQTYLISAPLVIPSRTTLDMTGCTVRLISGSNCNMVQNTGVTAVIRSFNPTTGAYTATGVRDSDIAVRGGLWDRQDNGDGASYNGHTMRFRHVDGLTVRDASFNSTAGKYQVNPGDCTRVTVTDLSLPAVSSDGVHLNGPCSQVIIRNIVGGTMGDDLVSLTARDSTSAITDCAGDITDVLIDGVSFVTAQTGLFASAFKVVAGQSDDTTKQFAVRRVTARNVTAPNTTADVAYIGDTSGGIIDDFTLDGVRSLGGSSRGCVLLHGGTIDRVRLRDLRPAATDAYAVGSDTNVTRVSVDGVEWVSSTGTPNVYFVPSGTVQRASITGVQGSAADGSAVLYVGASGTVQRAVVTACQLDGFRVVAGANGMALTSIDVANLDVIGAAYPLGNLFSVTTYKAANVTATGMSGWLWVLGSGAVTVTGASGLTGDNDTWAGNVLAAARGSNAFTVDPDQLTAGEETLDRRHVTDNGTVASGNLVLTYFTARKSETIHTVRTFVAGTAAAGTTVARIGIYRIEINGDHTLVASTANDTTLWNASFSGFTTSLSAAWAKQAGQRYAVGMLFVGTTGPTLRGVFPIIGAEDAFAPRINGNLTGQANLPASITTAVGQATGLSVYAAIVP